VVEVDRTRIGFMDLRVDGSTFEMFWVNIACVVGIDEPPDHTLPAANIASLNSLTFRQRRLDGSRVPSATCPSESVLPVRLMPEFPVVFGGYAGEAVNRVRWHEGSKRSLQAELLRSRELAPYWFRVAIVCFYSIIRRYRTVSALSSVWPLLRLRSNCIKLLFADSHK